MRNFSVLRLALITALFSVVVLNSGCAVISPYVSAPPGASTTYSAAENRARKVATDYLTNLRELDQFEFWSGVMVFGAAVAGSASAIFNANRDAVLGAATAGGTAAGTRAFLPTATRKKIYSQAFAAINCAIIATSVYNAPGSTGAPPSGPSPSNAPHLSALLASQQANLRSSVGVLTTSLATTSQNLENISGAFESAGTLASLQAKTLSDAAGTVPNKLAEAVAAVQQTEADSTRTLDRAVDVIAAAVHEQIAGTTVDPDKATQALKTVTKAAQEEVAAAAKAADEANKQLKDKAKETKSTADNLDAQAAGAKAVGKAPDAAPLTAAAAQLKRNAENAEALASQLQSPINRMLALIKLPEDCLGTLTK